MASYGDGSVALIIAAAGTVNPVLTGVVVVDHIIINHSSASIDLGVSLQTAAGGEVQGWDAVSTAAVQNRPIGLTCGPKGILIPKGLRVVTTSTLAFEITVLYRIIDSFAA